MMILRTTRAWRWVGMLAGVSAVCGFIYWGTRTFAAVGPPSLIIGAVECDVPAWIAGRVRQAEFRVPLANGGGQEIAIDGLDISCSCLQAAPTATRLPPGGGAELRGTLNLGVKESQGQVGAKLWVRFLEGDARHRLPLEVSVPCRAALVAFVGAAVPPTLSEGAAATALEIPADANSPALEFVVRQHEVAGTELAEPRLATTGTIAVKSLGPWSAPATDGAFRRRERRFRVAIKPSEQPGATGGTVQFFDPGDGSQLMLPVHWTEPKGYSLEPRGIVLRPGSGPAKVTLLSKNAGAAELRVAAAPPELAVMVAKTPAGAEATISWAGPFPQRPTAKELSLIVTQAGKPHAHAISALALPVAASP